MKDSSLDWLKQYKPDGYRDILQERLKSKMYESAIIGSTIADVVEISFVDALLDKRLPKSHFLSTLPGMIFLTCTSSLVGAVIGGAISVLKHSDEWSEATNFGQHVNGIIPTIAVRTLTPKQLMHQQELLDQMRSSYANPMDHR